MLSTLPSRDNNKCPHPQQVDANSTTTSTTITTTTTTAMELQQPSSIVNHSRKEDLPQQESARSAPKEISKAPCSVPSKGNSENGSLTITLDEAISTSTREGEAGNATTSAITTCANIDTAPRCSNNSNAHISFPLLKPKDTTPSAMCCATYPANNPCEDRFSILSNVILKRKSFHPPAIETNSSTSKESRLRISMICVLDGHGGSAVSEHASKTFLPLLQSNLAEGLDLEVDKEGHFFTSGNMNQTIGNDCAYVTEGYDHYRAPEVTNSGIVIPKVVDRCHIDDENDHECHVSLSASKATTSLQDSTPSSSSPPIVSDISSEENLSDEDKAIPGVPSSNLSSSAKKEQISTITHILRKTFVEWDEMYLNSIPLSECQEGVMKNGPCNSGACCLVNLLVQNESEDFSKESHSWGECRLFSAHVGDCKSVVYSNAKNAWDRKVQATDQSDQDEDGDFDEEDVTFSDDSSSEEEEEDPIDTEISDFSSRHEYQRSVEIAVDQSQPRPVWKRARLMKQSSNDTRTHHLSSCTYDTSNHSTSLRRKRRSSRINYTEEPKESLQATTLTIDHTPYDETEKHLVEERTFHYPRAIAKAANGGILRVGGSLSVTRALGDAYLKHKPLSFPPYQKHVPFLTAVPTVSNRVLDSFDQFLVLGSDGVWERCTEALLGSLLEDFEKNVGPLKIDKQNDNSYCRRVVSRGVTASNFSELSDTKVSDFIAKQILTVVGGKQKQSFADFQALHPGQKRRSIHDDITVCVIDLRRIIESKHF